ncbi:MAG: sulfatase-like hydrolase/transferase [Oscillospiraceae bacterium]|nr:sulfatase-like hydrolase/transferase [Oscillospiraceae bacterium]
MFLAIFPIALIIQELTLRIHTGQKFFDRGLIFVLLFSVALGLFMGVLASLFTGRYKRIAATVILLLGVLLYGTYAVYYTVFGEYVSVYSVQNVGMVISHFWRDALVGIWKTLIPLVFIAAPFVLYIIFGRRFTPQKRIDIRLLVLIFAAALALRIGTGLAANSTGSGIISNKYVYSESFTPRLIVPRFGIFTNFRLDVKRIISPNHTTPGSSSQDVVIPDEIINPTKQPQDDTETNQDENSEPSAEPIVYEPNILEIDFEELAENSYDDTIADMHRYFGSVTPTYKNQYTGMFEGKNLIWIVAEGFSTFALDEQHTPTLCKLASEGFVFNNFYNPIWGVSTSDGEYVATTGLIPKTNVWSYYRSSFISMPFGFGNMFSELGYYPRAYHDHDYTYYDRNLSHPNMGYDYKGLGNGLEVEETWPESDLEMMEKTIPEYINDDKFMVYYMTVSGHLAYNFYGNAMSDKHEEDVADLPYSEAARAYIACNMEFDLAMEKLIDELTKAGKLDDTLIVISGDHYPYGLEVSQMEELNGAPFTSWSDMYKSTLIIWNPTIETTVIDKYCSSLDIMPTLANLFGLDYDSRLVMGRDILSDYQELVIFNDMSFSTEYGTYYAQEDKFTPAENSNVSSDYARYILADINNKFIYSEKILDYDYYSEIPLLNGD